MGFLGIEGNEGLLLSIILMGAGLFLFVVNWALDIDKTDSQYRSNLSKFVPLCRRHTWTLVEDPIDPAQNYLICSVCKRIPGQNDGDSL